MSLGHSSNNKVEDRARYFSFSTAPRYDLFQHCGLYASCQPTGEKLSLGSLQ